MVFLLVLYGYGVHYVSDTVQAITWGALWFSKNLAKNGCLMSYVGHIVMQTRLKFIGQSNYFFTPNYGISSLKNVRYNNI